jgi:hypothetical protein
MVDSVGGDSSRSGNEQFGGNESDVDEQVCRLCVVKPEEVICCNLFISLLVSQVADCLLTVNCTR